VAAAVGGGLVGSAVGCSAGRDKPVKQSRSDTFGCNAEAERNQNMTSGALIGGAVGCGVGLLIGSVITQSGDELISAKVRDFAKLSLIARYPAGEPDFIRELGQESR